MKRLIVGGSGQGKLEYALKNGVWGPEDVGDGEDFPPEEALAMPVVYHLQQIVWNLMEKTGDAAEIVESALQGKADWVVICDEVGCGIVPTDQKQRRWREEVGQICCALAREADCVERITCGLPLCLKKER